MSKQITVDTALTDVDGRAAAAAEYLARRLGGLLGGGAVELAIRGGHAVLRGARHRDRCVSAHAHVRCMMPGIAVA